MTDEEYLIFLMKGGKVKKVSADEPRRVTDRQFYRAARDSKNERIER